MINFGYASHTGLKRQDEGNQDAIGLALATQKNNRPPLLIVADGMGGHVGGALASSIVVQTMIKTYQATNQGGGWMSILMQCVHSAHSEVRHVGQQRPELESMGSTVVAAIIAPPVVCLTNVGDSRAYLINQNSITQVSEDQSFVADLVRKGLITRDESLSHPHRNRLNMAISASRDDLAPFTTELNISPGDSLLLCSDGLWGVIPEEKIQRIVLENDPQKAADLLIWLANESGGPDNISVLIGSYNGSD